MDDSPEELTTEQLDELHVDLLASQEDLERRLAESKEQVKTIALDQPIGRLTRMDAMQQQKMAQEERRRREVRRKQVVVALAAFARDEFGYCKRCEEPIGYRRLKARPESPFCVGCMTAMERR